MINSFWENWINRKVFIPLGNLKIKIHFRTSRSRSCFCCSIVEFAFVLTKEVNRTWKKIKVKSRIIKFEREQNLRFFPEKEHSRLKPGSSLRLLFRPLEKCERNLYSGVIFFHAKSDITKNHQNGPIEALSAVIRTTLKKFKKFIQSRGKLV